jgi:hypothetical protein
MPAFGFHIHCHPASLLMIFCQVCITVPVWKTEAQKNPKKQKTKTNQPNKQKQRLRRFSHLPKGIQLANSHLLTLCVV